jgi:uncharacterized protein
MFRKFLAKISLVLRVFIITILKLYQYLISPLFGQRCRFYPNCSCYAIDSIKRFGVIKGGYLTTKRLLRCHPFNPGGFDPVPNKK